VTRVLIESGDGRSTWGTIGVSENIIEASWHALVDSIEYGLMHKRVHEENGFNGFDGINGINGVNGHSTPAETKSSETGGG